MSGAALRRWILAVSAVMALAAVGYAWAIHQARGPRVVLRADALHFQGPLLDESVQVAVQLLEQSPVPVRRVVLRSQGGDMLAAMQLGLQIHRRGLDVQVDGYCVAACASYVFTAGADKHILAGSLVAWFGSASAPEFLDGSWEARWRAAQQCQTLTPECQTRLERLREYLQTAHQQQGAFFAEIGVDAAITLHGQLRQPCECSWTFSPADMATFGITRVRSDGPYFTELGYWARQAAQENHVRLLSLASVP